MLKLEENDPPHIQNSFFEDFNLSFFRLLGHQNTESTSLF